MENEVMKMYKRCIAEQSANRQQELEQGLLELMGRKRYEDITVSELCTEMNVPRKSFYRYFSGKEGALWALIDHTLQKQVPILTAGRSAVESLADYFRFWQDQKQLLDALERSGLSGILVQRTLALSLTSEGIRKYFPDADDVSYEHMVLFLVSGFMALVIQWHHTGFPQTAEQMERSAARLLSAITF
ncbi:MAG: TetR/AcrR family transcriptional regulator [Oscillospiraceae bacterium]|nr:TetR/AcrR family transcriptional regulator [Oscillospiraceae bacterium]